MRIQKFTIVFKVVIRFYRYFGTEALFLRRYLLKTISFDMQPKHVAMT